MTTATMTFTLSQETACCAYLHACKPCVLAQGLRHGQEGPGLHVGKWPCASTQHSSVPLHAGEHAAASGDSTAASVALSASDVVAGSVASGPASTASWPCSSELELHAVNTSVTDAVTSRTRIFMRSVRASGRPRAGT
jgi:hypothetical protein